MARTAEEKKDDWRRASYNAISTVLARDYSYRNSWWYKSPDPAGPDVGQNLADWRRFVSKVREVYLADIRVAPRTTDETEYFDNLQSGNLGKLCNAMAKGTR